MKANQPLAVSASIFSNVPKKKEKDYFREELHYFHTDFQVQTVNSSLSLFFTLSEVKELKRLLRKKNPEFEKNPNPIFGLGVMLDGH